MAEKEEKTTTIQVGKEVYDWLLSLKSIEREPFNDVLLKIKNGEIKKW